MHSHTVVEDAVNDQPDRPFVAMQMPIGAGQSTAVGVHAPVGAVRRKDREAAARTRLDREGPGTVVLHTELPGAVVLQRREPDGGWEPIGRRQAAKDGRTAIDLPTTPGAPPARYRVVFAPKNSDIASWVSEPLEG